jgi:hypothetical protein
VGFFLYFFLQAIVLPLVNLLSKPSLILMAVLASLAMAMAMAIGCKTTP